MTNGIYQKIWRQYKAKLYSQTQSPASIRSFPVAAGEEALDWEALPARRRRCFMELYAPNKRQKSNRVRLGEMADLVDEFGDGKENLGCLIGL